MYDIELANNHNGIRYILGIDEAGRGSLAGPVVVGGVLILSERANNFFCGIRDSKQLSPTRREEWFRRIATDDGCTWAVARVGPHVIDRINIYGATLLGVRRVYQKLAGNRTDVVALLDGGLRLSRGVAQQTFIRGDAHIPVIAAASIVAKVLRDRMMVRLHRKYPTYNFDVHKGYGTLRHRALLDQYGPSGAHRKTFTWTRASMESHAGD